MIKQKSLTFTHILKRLFSSVITQLSEKSFSFSKIEKSSKSVEQLKSCNVTLINIKDFEQFSDSMNIAMIKIVTFKTLIKWSKINIFIIIILKINSFISTVKNKFESMNLHEFFHVKTFKQIKVKLLFKYYDYLNIFNWAMINQLLFHCFYDHKIELIAERISSWSRLYKMFDYKLQKIKEYNNNNNKIDNKIHLYMMSTMNLLILFYVQIEVRRVKRS